MMETLEIGEVAERTGLSHRALRFYEARGLVKPLRVAGERRVYGPAELARLNAVVALKRAGFSLAEIGRTLAGRHADLSGLVAAQIADLNRKLDELTASRGLLVTVQSRIDRGEPIDVATLCSLIRTGERHVEPENWKAVTDRYFTPQEKAEWREKFADVTEDFDQEAYGAQWKALSARIEAAMPMDPASVEAQGFVDEWFALLKPFSRIATPAMWNGTVRMYQNMDKWPAKADPGFSAEVWLFIQSATQARRAAGGTIEGPPWMTGSVA
ncbi:MerR family transcriptional regulator [Sphingomonas sp. CGMCC 1.13654]|uniref:MerR family transcriptional regulator n=1 Tax=Sphingomonas chungangi TaxID=2683589 RepID=A0A838L9B5_9SPHN|nr:MerR family transcriptional regulator [Sphingomonas chungangi]MBA2935129.1 MerR family transcriptional regulator [Sphingomonas chungangi]MVW56075.1 MerR family transcriptional regulator [Sphingomonas chungangi]